MVRCLVCYIGGADHAFVAQTRRHDWNAAAAAADILLRSDRKGTSKDWTVCLETDYAVDGVHSAYGHAQNYQAKLAARVDAHSGGLMLFQLA